MDDPHLFAPGFIRVALDDENVDHVRQPKHAIDQVTNAQVYQEVS